MAETAAALESISEHIRRAAETRDFTVLRPVMADDATWPVASAARKLERDGKIEELQDVETPEGTVTAVPAQAAIATPGTRSPRWP